MARHAMGDVELAGSVPLVNRGKCDTSSKARPEIARRGCQTLELIR